MMTEVPASLEVLRHELAAAKHAALAAAGDLDDFIDAVAAALLVTERFPASAVAEAREAQAWLGHRMAEVCERFVAASGPDAE